MFIGFAEALETEPGCGGEGQLFVVPHRFVFLALHGRHSKTSTGHVEKLRLRPKGYRGWEEGLEDSPGIPQAVTTELLVPTSCEFQG